MHLHHDCNKSKTEGGCLSISFLIFKNSGTLTSPLMILRWGSEVNVFWSSQVTYLQPGLRSTDIAQMEARLLYTGTEAAFFSSSNQVKRACLLTVPAISMWRLCIISKQARKLCLPGNSCGLLLKGLWLTDGLN